MSSAHPEIYYYYDDDTRTVFWSETEVSDRPDLVFINSSTNPNKKMAVATFTQMSMKPMGWKIKQLPD